MDLLKSIRYPDEIKALFQYKLNGRQKTGHGTMSESARTCYRLLNKTSRSFSAVIQALDDELRHPTCIFYLVLRALDTVEDDMTIPMETKIPLLRRFYSFLKDPEWRYLYSEEKDKEVLEKFPVISAEFRTLKPVYQDVISDICRRMGEGMTVYLDRAPDTLADWDEYCHYVAGLVGIGLSRLFSASGLEDPVVGENEALSNSMGLFLQKTNIIRDYLEDVQQERDFWPKEVWGKYAKQQRDLYAAERRNDAMTCLNDLITNALRHIPDCVTYLSRLSNQSVFNFCAIPQVMAIATLERCYDNYDVFRGVVKIRKGEAVRLMQEATDINRVKAIFSHFVMKMQQRIPNSGPGNDVTRESTERALRLCVTDSQYETSSRFYPLYISCAMLTSAILWTYWTSFQNYVDETYQ